MRLQPVLYLLVIIALLYYFRIEVVVNAVNGFIDTWNYTIEYTLHLKDKQPVIFLLLPIGFVYLLGRK